MRSFTSKGDGMNDLGHIGTEPYTPDTNGKGRTLRPDLLARMGLCPYLPNLGTVQSRTALMAIRFASATLRTRMPKLVKTFTLKIKIPIRKF